MILEPGTFIELPDSWKSPHKYIEAIKSYHKYSASTAKVLAEIYKTSVNLETTLTQNEIAQRTGLNCAVVSKSLCFLVKEGFLEKLGTSRQFRVYLISQDKLDKLVAIYEVKRNG